MGGGTLRPIVTPRGVPMRGPGGWRVLDSPWASCACSRTAWRYPRREPRPGRPRRSRLQKRSSDGRRRRSPVKASTGGPPASARPTGESPSIVTLGRHGAPMASVRFRPSKPWSADGVTPILRERNVADGDQHDGPCSRSCRSALQQVVPVHFHESGQARCPAGWSAKKIGPESGTRAPPGPTPVHDGSWLSGCRRIRSSSSAS